MRSLSLGRDYSITGFRPMISGLSHVFFWKTYPRLYFFSSLNNLQLSRDETFIFINTRIKRST